jgi:single-strand DNA-binding protein
MASSFNKVILMGNLTRDVETRFTPSGAAVTEIGLAVNEKRKQGEQWVDEVVFVDITLWGKTAEVCAQYCQKGSPLFVEGKLKLDVWEKDGKKNYKLKVVGERIQLLGSRSEGGGQQQSSQPSGSYNVPVSSNIGGDDPDSIPF